MFIFEDYKLKIMWEAIVLVGLTFYTLSLVYLFRE